MPCANCTCSGSQSKCTSRLADGVSVTIRSTKKGTSLKRLWDTTSEPASGRPAVVNYGSTNDTQADSADETQALLNADSASSSSASSSSVPVKKCEKHDGIRGVCCRDLKRENGVGHLVNPDVVRDVIIGLSDGLTVPFALTAGLSGVGSTRIVVLAGIAELISGAISMALGGLLSAQAEVQHYRYMERATQERVMQSCSGLLEKEVCDILEPFGVPSEIGALVAAKLQSVERQEGQSIGDSLPVPATQQIPPPPRRSDGLVGPQRGLTPFLVRLGEGLEKVEESRVWQSAVTIGLSYLIGGTIPLLPYVLLNTIQEALLVSIVVTGIVLLIFGVVKQICTGAERDVRGLLYGAFSTLFVGAAAAGSSYMIVRAVEGGSA